MMFAILKSMRCLIGSQWSCWRRVRGLQDREQVTTWAMLDNGLACVSINQCGQHNTMSGEELQTQIGNNENETICA